MLHKLKIAYYYRDYRQFQVALFALLRLFNRINGIDLQIRGELAQHLDNPIREVSIEFVVAAEGNDPMLAGLVLQLEPWCSHGDAQRLRLSTPGHHAPVVVSE